MTDRLDFDPFDLLELNQDCTKKDVIAAFRRLALKWHPDKNPDDKKESAKHMFLKIQKSFEILTDPAAKAALVQLKKAKEAQKLRVKKLDAKRQKLRDELEQREKKAAGEKMDEKMCTKKFEAEIERLRKEGSKLLKEENERLEREFSSTMLNRTVTKSKDDLGCRIKTNTIEEHKTSMDSLDDLENIVFRKMKEAQEKKKKELEIPTS